MIPMEMVLMTAWINARVPLRGGSLMRMGCALSANTSPSGSTSTDRWFESNPEGIEPSTTGSYTPNSAADVANPSNANKVAIITNSFDCTGCNWAPGQVIDPNGGAITGSNINLNGAFIRSKAARAHYCYLPDSHLFMMILLSTLTLSVDLVVMLIMTPLLW